MAKRRPLKKIREAISRMSRADGDVLIGVHADDAARDEPTSGDEAQAEELNNADIAMIHEYGLGVPERSFLRSTVRENLGDYRRLLARELRRQLRGPAAMAKRPLHVVGNKAVADVQETINRGIEPPLSEATLRRRQEKGFKGTKALVVTGQLKASITYSVASAGEQDE